MNLTDIMLFGKAIIGDGGSSESGLETVTFDGNLIGKESFSGEMLGGYGVYVKVTDSLFTADELQEFSLTVITTNGEKVTNNVVENITAVDEELDGIVLRFFSDPNSTIWAVGFLSDVNAGEGLVITAGTYILYNENYMGLGTGYVSSLVYGKSGGVKALAWHTGMSGLEVYDNDGVSFTKLSNTPFTKNDIEGGVFGVKGEGISLFESLTGEVFDALVMEEDGLLGIAEIFLSGDDTAVSSIGLPSGGVWVLSGVCKAASLVWGL